MKLPISNEMPVKCGQITVSLVFRQWNFATRDNSFWFFYITPEMKGVRFRAHEQTDVFGDWMGALGCTIDLAFLPFFGVFDLAVLRTLEKEHRELPDQRPCLIAGGHVQSFWGEWEGIAQEIRGGMPLLQKAENQ